MCVRVCVCVCGCVCYRTTYNTKGERGQGYALWQSEERLLDRLLRALDDRSDELDEEAGDAKELGPEVVDEVDDQTLRVPAM